MMDARVLSHEPDLDVEAIAETLLQLRQLILRFAENSTDSVDARRTPARADGETFPSTVERRPPVDRLRPDDRSPVRVGRCRLHRMATAHIAAHLRSMGLDVQPTNPVSGSDLLINDGVRIAVRAAHRTTRQQRVRIGGRLYHYQRRSWQFNFHRHGRIGRRYCDYFICLPITDPNRATDLREALIIPWTARRGKTLGIPQRPYGGWYAKYRNAWEQLRDRCAREAVSRARQVAAA